MNSIDSWSKKLENFDRVGEEHPDTFIIKSDTQKLVDAYKNENPPRL